MSTPGLLESQGRVCLEDMSVDDERDEDEDNNEDDNEDKDEDDNEDDYEDDKDEDEDTELGLVLAHRRERVSL